MTACRKFLLIIWVNVDFPLRQGFGKAGYSSRPLKEKDKTMKPILILFAAA